MLLLHSEKKRRGVLRYGIKDEFYYDAPGKQKGARELELIEMELNHYAGVSSLQ